MQGSFRLGSVAGIAVGLHYTWLFAFALVTWSLAENLFPLNFPGWDPITYWLVGSVAALGLFTSVLAHELTHSFVALARGLRVRGITLFIFGGVSNIAGEAARPLDEFLISIVGPVSSFLLAGIFWAAHQAAAPGNTPLGAMLEYLALTNLLLGAFNLVPGFPLDGGRVLRSAIWAITRSPRRATQIASYVGQAFGLLLVFLGLSRLLGGALLDGLWTAFIGWFLNSAAESTRQQQAVQESLRGIRVAELMNPSPPTAGPEMTVQEFVFENVLRNGHRAVLVADGGRLLGIVSVTDAKEVPHELWASTPVGRIMTRVPLKTVPRDADLATALRMLVEGELNQVPVVRGEEVVGLLCRADILRFLQLRDELHLRGVTGPNMGMSAGLHGPHPAPRHAA